MTRTFLPHAPCGYGAVMRAASVFAVLVGAVATQEPPTKQPLPPTDPYTLGDPAAMQKAGYESFGPFPFAAGKSTADVSALLGSEPLIWIETAHFKIGCALSALPLKNDEEWRDDWIARLKPELKRLGERLPRIKTNAKELDPWLRAHLIAQRCEDLYAAALANLGLSAWHFPVAADDPANPATFRGLGPHFGMPQKFLVLLVRKGSSHARFTRAYQKVEIADPIRYHDTARGGMYWGASEETANGLFRHDYALHAHLAFNVAHNLYTCYRGYAHDLPPWFVTGLAHCHSRAASPRFPTYDRSSDSDKDPRSPFWQWDQRVVGLVKNEALEPMATLFDRTSAGGFGIEQHIMSWSVVDWLLANHKAKAMQFLHVLKDPHHERRRAPTDEELRLRQLDALQSCLGWTPQQLEAEWRRDVLAKKGRK
jgi:hypothetical protein